MKMTAHPLFKDIFNEPKPHLEELIKGLPSEMIITFLCNINAKLKFASFSKDDQLEILMLLLQGQQEEYKKQLFINTLTFYERNEDNVVLFSSKFTLDFMHHEIMNFRDFERNSVEEPRQFLNLIKAYFLFMENTSESLFKNQTFTKSPADSIHDHFRKKVWPTFFEQIESQHKPEIYPVMIRGVAFLELLKRDGKYKSYVESYLKIYEAETPWKYAFKVMKLLEVGLSVKNREVSFPNSAINYSEEYATMLDNLTLNIEEYQLSYSNNKANYNGFKSKPLIKFQGGDRYLVTDWNMMYNKFNDGLLFDFYERSNIKELPEFKTFLDFKNFVGFEISERFLFRKVCEKIFPEKRKGKLIFPEGKGMPDAYYREGQNIMLIEFKDSLMAGNTISSLSYEEIVKAIDTKYNTDSKGTGQLIKYIDKLKDSSFYEGSTNYKIKGRKDLVIYPVIIFTDKFFGVDGVSHYLSKQFEMKLHQSKLSDEFLSIKPLACFDFNKMVSYFIALAESQDNLFDLIDRFNERIKKRIRRAHELNTFDSILGTQNSIESEFLNSLERKAVHNKGYLPKMVAHFDLPVN
ncbi:MAG: hypothetical protein JWO03_3710 [Bacteroidetes bacterium]|nr:hypothetical protein [Bacteroidota bacterium]